jgi:acetyltransferase-like isoleucine patch superfamily enzyme
MVGVNRPCGISTYSKSAQIIIGNNCGFSGTILGAANSIALGEHVLCGANVLITDFDWHENRVTGIMDSSPVLIEDNVWLGANCIVLKGVHIGKNTVVGANAVVTSSLPANVIAAGNPARVIRALS